jgi:hypothetical protein
MLRHTYARPVAMSAKRLRVAFDFSVERIGYYINLVQTAVWRFLVRKLLPIVATSRLQIYRKLRHVANTFVCLAIVLALAAPFFHLVKMVALAGLMFDVAGVFRLFMDDEWDELLQFYKDETKYPNGPPSYVTRELFADTNVEVAADTEENDISRYYYRRRGFLLIVVGFLLQALAVILA